MGSRTLDEIKKAKKKQQRKNSVLGKIIAGIQDSFVRNPLQSSLLISFVLALVVCGFGGVFAWQELVVKEKQHQMEKFSENAARIAASNVANYIHDVHQKLEFFSNSSSLISALSYNDSVGRLEIENALKNSFQNAIGIRLFAVGEAKLDLEGDPPLRFSELELIRAAETRAKVIPEALKLGRDEWRFNVVVPVPQNTDQDVAGTIMVTLPMTQLFNELGKGASELGKVTMYQSFEGKQRLVVSKGQGSLYKAQAVKVPETPWSVEFVASEKLYEQAEVEYTLVAMAGGMAALGVIAVFMLTGFSIGRSYHNKRMAFEDTRRKMGHEDVESSKHNELSVKIRKDDEGLLSLADDATSGESDDPLDIRQALEEAMREEENQAPAHIFRSYDIRGLAEKEISNDFAHRVGQALGSEALDAGEKALIVARDARTHSPLLTENLIRGILSTGCKVINIGTAPTPLLYFATETFEESKSGVMVTASHNPAEYNGFKVVMGGKARTENDIQALRQRITKQQFRQGIGSEEHKDIVDTYIDTIFSDIALAGDIKIVIDAGNGVTGKVAPRLFDELGCQVVPLYCDLDGTFPNHGPDPSVVANLQDLIKKVKEENAHLGVAFDGDGDRLAVVTPKGEIIWPDRLLMLFAKDILSRNPGGDVVFDVKSTRLLNSVVSSNGGRPIMWKTGHAPMRTKMVETGALVGGEFSGHIFIKDRWYGFDDGMYTAARLIEIMSLRDETLDEIFDEFPSLIITPEIRINVPESKKFELIETLKSEGDFGEAKLATLDGIRAEFPYGWGLVRASNTSAHITLRFEAESDEQIHSLKSLFTREIRKIDSTIDFKW